jgi:hypothetical protein
MPESIDPDDPLSSLDRHVAVITKVDGDWYILDVDYEEPINISKDIAFGKNWVLNFDYINVFRLEPLEVTAKESERLLKQWNRIMKGEPAQPRGGDHKRLNSQRTLVLKTRRTFSSRDPEGKKGKRKSDAT